MTPSLSSIIIFLIGHWVGDYVLQTNAIAKEKSASFKWLLIHVAMYTAIISICAMIVLPREIWAGFIALNGLLHLLTDFVTGKLRAIFSGSQRLYFIIIGLDQMIHSITLLGSVYILPDILT